MPRNFEIRAEARALLARLGVPASALVEGAYVDLLRAAQATRADTGA
ncbi:hypothetical protein QO239_26485 [Cupriavidus taiwanensis]|nr:hypothetical protein [Cupriavidus taiwanensis]MDK3026155.1 hypothetical protein [Cupriavidus taiwanensis]